jgi:hypothetical protein
MGARHARCGKLHSADYNSPFVVTTIAMSVPAVSASRKRGHR